MNSLDKFKTFYRLKLMNDLKRLRYSAISFYCCGILNGISMSLFLNGNLFLGIYSIVSIILLVFVFKLISLNNKEFYNKVRNE